MRATPLLVAVLGIAALTGCGSDPKARPADAGAGPGAPAGPAGPATSGAKPPAPGAGIRTTDWRNVTLLRVPKLGDVTFHNGSGGGCRMLPGGAAPAYGHLLADEPANRTSAEDAVVLVECGESSGGAAEQRLIPVQANGAKRVATGAINPNNATEPGPITFTAYSIDNGRVVATVRKPDGKTEARRYGWGGNGWERT